MRVFIAGGTGLIGTRLVGELRSRGDRPVVLTRRASGVGDREEFRGVELVQGDPTRPGDWQGAVDGCDAVVNLAGSNIFSKRWSAEVRRTIRESRVRSTEHLVDATRRASRRPSAFVLGSAIGYYGPTGDEELTESSPPGTDFMAEVCKEWEAAAGPASGDGTRLAIVRTGVVLARGEGALGVMTPIFKWVPGGAAPIGSGSVPFAPATGRQWFSWIHLADIVGIFLMALDRADALGPINGTAPRPVRNVEFGRALARVLHRPFLPVGPPDVALRVVLGGVAEAVTRGQRVLPGRATGLGYQFRFPEVNEALEDLLGSHRSARETPRPTSTA
ncbi:TIGR01777 family oxidoreductase [Tautonia plasticadhaerens]|uniref:Epimerase family protein n=1 Tax=Tautonia plasticadhaerens TaxID=2527974 RepID=A0A518GYT3_9BACT|nr:TIGR01777 family oxidoreductase [Tautonia plasticadhaerens]QDV33770.1 Epimerase family protein [Tautonia plasticadhaerens]